MKNSLAILLSLAASALATSLSSLQFHIKIDDTTGSVVEVTDPTARKPMNWVSAPHNAPWQTPSSRWGLGYADLGEDLLHRSFWNTPQTFVSDDGVHVSTYMSGQLELAVSRTIGDAFTERYTFTNKGNSPLDLSSKGAEALGIYTPFNDHYTNTTDALQNRAHAHVWANGQSTAWVKMDQMGGHERNLGLVLTRGSLAGYSIEGRDPITLSNTRGVFVLHPTLPVLQPGESDSVEWSLFWHSDWEDFFSKCATRSEQFIRFDVKDFTLVEGEEVIIGMSGAVDENTIVSGKPVECDGRKCTFVHQSGELGEHELVVRGPSKNSTIFLNTVPDLDTLIFSRTKFIIENQQLPDTGNATDGAYVVFDTQARVPALWDTASDRGPGRERLGMGILMSRWLRKHPENAVVRRSLERYYSYVCLKLQDEDGYVLNKPGTKKEDSKRLYNWPWVLQFHISVAAAYHQGLLSLQGPVAEKLPLERFMLTLENFYDEGGAELYAIGLPILEALRFLHDAGETKYFERTLSLFVAHGEVILRRGLNYPPSEVNFEQAIVAPAAVMMIELYRFTGNETWLEAAELQLETLLRFEGKQPDYRLHDVAIRHWDGYWFGKERLWGDTFPHYWSTLDAVALHHYSLAVSDKEAGRRADRIIRANLGLFSPDGTAGCAWVYPLTVNGRDAHKRDPYANDQDWVLNHLLYIIEDSAYRGD